MKYSQISPGRVLIIALKRGDDLLEAVKKICTKERIYGGSIISGIGTFSRCRLGYFDLDNKEYQTININEPVELVSTSGTITIAKKTSFPHIHLIVADSKGRCFGGHAMSECIVSVTVELMILVFDGELHRKLDPETNLMLLDPQ
ncbi:MAG: PPC domain-containing DNA-binding protein [Candidatus Hodarchaeota archaeon]